MKIFLTGNSHPLGYSLQEHLSRTHEILAVGGWPDWSDADRLAECLQGVQAVVHAASYESGSQDDTTELEHASLGSYMLATAARKAGVKRIVVISSLTIYDAYPDDFLLDEMWEPRPDPHPAQLVPYLAEQSVREFAREGGINGVCLRFMPIGDDPERNTRLSDALCAVDHALALPYKVPGYRWHVFHVANSARYLMREANLHLGFNRKELL